MMPIKVGRIDKIQFAIQDLERKYQLIECKVKLPGVWSSRAWKPKRRPNLL